MTVSIDLSGRVAIVTGASRGIGAAIARALDAAGCRVALVGRDREALEDVRRGLAGDALPIVADLDDPETITHLVHRVIRETGRLDILVNNAGVVWRRPVTELDASTVDGVLRTNVRAPLLLIAAAVPSLRAAGRASIVNVSSVSGLVGTPERSLYAASKGALDALTRSLAIELGPSGIRVNSIAPGVVVTDMWAENRAMPGVIELVEQSIPLRSWAEPEDIANVVVFLASDQSSQLTGTTIPVDGGMATTRELFSGSAPSSD